MTDFIATFNMLSSQRTVNIVMKLKVASLNVRGLANDGKREVFQNWIKAKKLSIYIPQEVHRCDNTSYVNGVTKRFLAAGIGQPS